MSFNITAVTIRSDFEAQENIIGFIMTKQVRIFNSQRMKTQDTDLTVHTILQ